MYYLLKVLIYYIVIGCVLCVRECLCSVFNVFD